MAATVRSFGPGRVNLIGEHTDYNGGLALPFAIELGVAVTASELPTRVIEVRSLDLDETDSFSVDEPERVTGWRAFVHGAVGELARAGIDLPGARVEIAGDIPRGAGLSSSGALEVALTTALIALSGEPAPERTELAKLCARVENDWVGAQTGLLDQMASLYGRSGHALRIDFRTLEVRPVPLELDGYSLVTLDSGSPHLNAVSGYNERRAECARACELLGIPSLREASLETAERLPEPLNRRVRHVLSSNARVELAVEALARRDFETLGRLLNESHASLRDDYEISTPAVEKTVLRIQRAGALGARMIGGGFGGHVLGLLPPEATPPDGSLEVRPGPGAKLLS